MKLIFCILITVEIAMAQPSVVFTHQENNNDNIFLIDPSGTLKAITNNNRKDSSPSVSPDGKWIVFTSERIGWWKIWKMNLEIKEFTVAGIPHGSLFAHRWFVGTDSEVDPRQLRDRIDGRLKELNDDYAVERSAALKEVMVDILPVKTFYEWMEWKGKVGGQNKFPRVMKKAQLDEWLEFLKDNKA